MYLKCLGNIQEWFPHTKIKKKIRNNTCPQADFVVQFNDVLTWNLYIFIYGETYNILMYSAATENEETLYQRIFDACETIRNRLETLVRAW